MLKLKTFAKMFLYRPHENVLAMGGKRQLKHFRKRFILHVTTSKAFAKMSLRVSSCLMAHQHIIGHAVT